MKFIQPFFTWAIAAAFLVAMQSCDPEQQKQVGNQVENPDMLAKPFTRWWWMGNTVTPEGISAELEAMAEVGIGGVEITPIYGVKGYEDQIISFLDSTWFSRLQHTLEEADRLGLLVDMNLGTGWPFGGPQISPEHAAKKVEIYSFPITRETESIKLLQNVDEGALEVRIEAVIAVDADDQVWQITDKVQSGAIILNDSIRKYPRLFALVSMLTGQQVKRAAPGGEGYVLDHFNKSAVTTYLARFENAFAEHNLDASRIRSFFNDSYEVYQANWTSNYLQHFRELHQYDFADYFYLLKDTTASDLSSRIASDYRKTLETLLQDNFTTVVNDWCAQMGVKFRNQSHGSPGNLLDLYATVDIPEAETFHSSNFQITGLKQDTFIFYDRPNPLILKYASSAAHTSGKQLVSSETATWLDEHFTVTLKKIKPEVDHLIANGINHIFYHGTTYSPVNETWPGWLFYASTHVNPVNTWWNDMKALNDYIATCQHYLQNSQPDHDVLLYWSAAESYAREKDTKLQQFSIHSSSWIDQDLTQLASQMLDQGYTFDYISDRQLQDTQVQDGLIKTKGAAYKVIVVPATDFMPEATWVRLNELSRQGVKIIIQEHVPNYFTGFNNQQKAPRPTELVDEIVIADRIIPELTKLNIRREPLVDADLIFFRKLLQGQKMYFIANNTSQDVSQWISLSSNFKSANLLDPLTQKHGKAKVKNENQVYLQLKSGQSVFLFLHAEKAGCEEDWFYYETAGEGVAIAAEWEVSFIKGGPALPASRTINQLQSWHQMLEGTEQYFSGTATYTTTFAKPAQNPDYWLLNLEGVHESVQVSLNGKKLDTLFSLPMEMIIPDELLQENNRLELKISNLMANRIKYMDQNQIEWRKFHEINFVNIHYEAFDATDWEFQPSGLLKAPELIPLADKKLEALVTN